jgi:hypothetical protein
MPDWIDTVPPALPHKVTWEIDTEEITGAVTCKAQPGALCRLMCAEDCGSEVYPCYSEDENGEQTMHGLVGAGYCNAVTEFENTGERLEIHYDGKCQTVPRHGWAKVRWNGDGWVWEYLDNNEVLSCILGGLIRSGDGDA